MAVQLSQYPSQRCKKPLGYACSLTSEEEKRRITPPARARGGRVEFVESSPSSHGYMSSHINRRPFCMGLRPMDIDHKVTGRKRQGHGREV